MGVEEDDVRGDKDDVDEIEGEEGDEEDNRLDNEPGRFDGDEEIDDDDDDDDGGNVDEEAVGKAGLVSKEEREHEDCNGRATADGTTGVGGPWTFLVW